MWSIHPNTRPLPFVGIWPREGGKSVSAELAAVALGARTTRHYIWYVRETQDQADGSVTNIMDMLESAGVEEYYPELGQRELGKYGQPRGWRRQQLRTASGLTIDAIGLDTAVRGARVKEHRPDFIILDDLDGKHDTPKATGKKIDTLTTSLLPAGSQDCAILAIQNLIIPDGIFARLGNTLKCQNCGKDYQTTTHQKRLRGSRFCSSDCQYATASIERRGENNPNWTGGTADPDAYGPNWERQKRRTKQRDGHTCQVCHYQSGGSRCLDVHHIVPIKTFGDDWETANRLTNLVSLCRLCHCQVEKGKIPQPMVGWAMVPST